MNKTCEQMRETRPMRRGTLRLRWTSEKWAIGGVANNRVPD